jgi:LacI family transcriptional regulator
MISKTNVTISRIAAEAKVSIATVSRALNNSEKVDKNLQLKIVNIAERMGYKRFIKSQLWNESERNMKFIVLIFGRIGPFLRDEIEQGIDERLRKTGYYEIRYLIDERVEMDSDAKKELFLKNIINEKGISGILCSFIKISDSTIAMLNRHKLPVVLLNNTTEFGKCVSIDNFKAAYDAVCKLSELGRKNIGCIMPHEEIAQVWTDRINGYIKGLKDRGLKYHPDSLVYEDTFDMKQAGLMTRALLEVNPDTDAILYGGDQQAYGGMKMLKELGKKIPDDMAVIGFDDMQTNEILQPSLSSVRQPMFEMGKTGIEMLLKAIDAMDFSHEQVVLESRLMLRGTCLRDYEEKNWSFTK